MKYILPMFIATAIAMVACRDTVVNPVTVPDVAANPEPAAYAIKSIPGAILKYQTNSWTVDTNGITTPTMGQSTTYVVKDTNVRWPDGSNGLTLDAFGYLNGHTDTLLIYMRTSGGELGLMTFDVDNDDDHGMYDTSYSCMLQKPLQAGATWKSGYTTPAPDMSLDSVNSTVFVPSFPGPTSNVLKTTQQWAAQYDPATGRTTTMVATNYLMVGYGAILTKVEWDDSYAGSTKKRIRTEQTALTSASY